VAILKNWFDECASGHQNCKRQDDPGAHGTTEPELPTRILDVRPENDEAIVRLVEQQGARGDYVALSHCWGPPSKRPICTTRNTLVQHLAGLSLSCLPKTFQDAVAVTRTMNLRYLWIDSLCIIQDDLDDWSREAPRIGELYSHASLVIAASGARDSSEGCFLERPPLEPTIDIPYITENGDQRGHVQVNMSKYREIAPGKLVGPLFEPLGERGWVFQEWTLARRIVHFTSKGMMWSCRALGGDAMCKDGYTMEERLAKTWDDVIGFYTLRNLTYPTDKLAAVEGLARIMQRGRAGRYVSGVWTDDLPQQLFWIGRGTTRPLEQRIFPSWSWASTHGPCVTTSDRLLPDKITLLCGLEIKNAATLVVYGKANACLIKRVAIPLGETRQLPPFAEFMGMCSITMMQYLLVYPRVSYHLLDPDTRRLVGFAIMDDEGDVGNEEILSTSLLLMQEIGRTSVPEREEPIFLALLLKEVSVNEQAHQRIGAAFIVDKQFFEVGDRADFTIV
jgi:hypothetical protein